MKGYLKTMICLFALVGVWGCNDDGTPADDLNRPLAEGELCKVSLVLDDVSGYQAVKSRSSQESGDSILSTQSIGVVKVPGKRTPLELSVEVSASPDVASTRAYDNSGQIFGGNSTFRMLVFSGNFGTGIVDMTKPTHNMVCQVNAGGNGASFIAPVTSLELPKGDYKFICFPADDKFNTWRVGATLTTAKENEKSVSQGDDFVCLTTGVISLGSAAHQINLGTFTRTGYLFTCNFINDSGAALTSPVGKMGLAITDNGTTNRVINGSAKVDILTKSVSNYGNFLIKDTIKMNGSGANLSFIPFSKLLLANETASEKLKITYPALTFTNAAGSVTIPSGIYMLSNANTFKAGYKYTISLRVGPTPKPSNYIMVGGVKWAKGNLDYNSVEGFFIAPTPDQVSDSDPDALRKVHGAMFRWFAPYSQNAQMPFPSTANSTTQSSTVTTPNWSGVAGDLGNYNYYKNYMPTPTFNASAMTVNTLGDPCTALPGGKWRMPTYNEIYLLCYYSSGDIPSGTFTGNRRLYGQYFNTVAKNHSLDSYPKVVNDRWYGIYFDKSEKPGDNPAAPFVGSDAPLQYDSNRHLFLPAASYSNGATVGDSGYNKCYYWSSTPYTTRTWVLMAYTNAIRVSYDATPAGDPMCGTRDMGRSVRCVLDD